MTSIICQIDYSLSTKVSECHASPELAVLWKRWNYAETDDEKTTALIAGIEAYENSLIELRATLSDYLQTAPLPPIVIKEQTQATDHEAIRHEIKRLSALWSQAHYGDDDVRASEIRCQIEELQAELDG